ncbi:MAG: UDP-glucose 4-epimerase GalE [Blastochloris viridis]|uniref:UDP-glucose 4-epimerase n=1 Tax=Blastochloris viridis TaxID=1079 RepID=A0A6N4R2X5_BLAVI|nr:MAG: UDP-glucose 4-epimerase GalE [Blastochloris viridis]
MTQHILVTGGAGYIGSHTCQALAKAGYTPVVFDNFFTGNRWAVKYGPLVEGDTRNAADLQAAFETYKPVAVIHLAALLSVPESVSEPADYYQTNTFGAWQLLNTIRATTLQGTKPIPVVFSSTAAVYGIPESSPISEKATLNPINPYGRSKLMTEQMLADYSHAYGLNSVSLRYFNAAGASENNEIGAYRKNPFHLIPVALEAVVGTRPQLQIMGTDYPTEDGTAVRDYIHVTDLAEAHVASLEYLLKGGETVSLNLGTGQGYSVKQVVDAIGQEVGKPVPATYADRRAGDPPALVADSSRAQALLNWKPHLSDLPTLVRTAWAWRQTDEAKGDSAI